jgi:hypothetical protein
MHAKEGIREEQVSSSATMGAKLAKVDFNTYTCTRARLRLKHCDFRQPALRGATLRRIVDCGEDVPTPASGVH